MFANSKNKGTLKINNLETGQEILEDLSKVELEKLSQEETQGVVGGLGDPGLNPGTGVSNPPDVDPPSP